MLCLIHCTSHSQTKPVKDLNKYERVQALYKINEQRKFYRKQFEDCVSRCSRALDSITQVAIDMGIESKEFSSHNLDLQEGLLSSLKKQEEQEKKIIELESSKRKRISIGPYVGYDFFQNKASGGISVQYSIFSF